MTGLNHLSEKEQPAWIPCNHFQFNGIRVAGDDFAAEGVAQGHDFSRQMNPVFATAAAMEAHEDIVDLAVHLTCGLLRRFGGRTWPKAISRLRLVAEAEEEVRRRPFCPDGRAMPRQDAS